MFLGLYWMRKNNKCDDGGWAQMNVYIPRSTITNECTTSIMMLVFDKKGLVCFRTPAEGLWRQYVGVTLLLEGMCGSKGLFMINVFGTGQNQSAHTVLKHFRICSAHKNNNLSSLNSLDSFAIEAALLTLQTKINRAFFSNVRTLWLTPPCTGTKLMMCRESGKTVSSDLQLRTDICKQWCLTIYSSC